MPTAVSMKEWESKSAMLAHLVASRPRTLLVGLASEAPQAFYSFSIVSAQAVAEVGVISSGLGAAPAAVVFESERRVLVGHDTWVTGIDGEALVVSSMRIGGVFFEFLTVDRDDEIVAVHELGALRVDSCGSIRWSIDTDVVEDFGTDTKGNLVLTVMGGPRVVVSVASGAIARGCFGGER